MSTFTPRGSSHALTSLAITPPNQDSQSPEPHSPHSPQTQFYNRYNHPFPKDAVIVPTISSQSKSNQSSRNTSENNNNSNDSKWKNFLLSRIVHTKKNVTGFTKEQRRMRKVSEFYDDQNALIESLLRDGEESQEEIKKEQENTKKVKIAIYGSFFANILLFALQLYAAISSQSLSLFATMADSFMDLLSSTVMVATERMMSKVNWSKYPTGKSRLETSGIIVFASLMSTVSIQLIIQSIKDLVSTEHDPITLETLAISFVGFAQGLKFLLYLYCTALRAYPSAAILALDHRNDLFVNGFGLAASIIASKIPKVWWIDPVGALVVAILIMFSWGKTGWEHIELIVGKSAEPQFLQKITFIALYHDERIVAVDTVRAYFSGSKLYVEVDIVLSPEMPLRESHDLGESLQIKLESLDQVERAFVHLDYETDHPPEHRKDV